MIFYEDHVRIKNNLFQSRSSLLQSLLGASCFEEVVAGIDEIYVKYDPYLYDEEIIKSIIKASIHKDQPAKIENQSHELPIYFDDAPDIDMMAHYMQMDKYHFIKWFKQRIFHVEMMGFQPGFAYLGHDSSAPKIDRLAAPRAKVKSGSIGFLGTQACIYAHDGPGGWPIIGHIATLVFNLDNDPPNLLQNGDYIKFI